MRIKIYCYALFLLSVIFYDCNETNNKMKFRILQKRSSKEKYLGLEVPPDNKPKIFLKNIVSTKKHNHSSPAISPNGDEIYWSVYENMDSKPFQKIFYMKKEGENWSSPKIAEFSGEYSNGGPCFSPKGDKLFFYSERPLSGTSNKIENDIWFVERKENHWSIPKNIGVYKYANREKYIFSPSITNDGTVYFTGYLKGIKSDHGIYRIRYHDGVYSEPESLPDVINSKNSFNWIAYIAPDESYLIFSSDRYGSRGYHDLYISYNSYGHWDDPINLGKLINNGSQVRFPSISPDGKYLFFVRDYPSNVYWVRSDILPSKK